MNKELKQYEINENKAQTLINEYSDILEIRNSIDDMKAYANSNAELKKKCIFIKNTYRKLIDTIYDMYLTKFIKKEMVLNPKLTDPIVNSILLNIHLIYIKHKELNLPIPNLKKHDFYKYFSIFSINEISYLIAVLDLI